MTWFSIALPFATTLLGSGLAVPIALWIQRRAFRARAQELELQTADSRSERLAAQEARRQDREAAAALVEKQQLAQAEADKTLWRRELVTRAFDIIDEARTLLGMPASSDKSALLEARIDSIQMLFRVDPEPHGNVVGEWFKRNVGILGVMGDFDHDGTAATARFYLIEWTMGRKTSESFNRD